MTNPTSRNLIRGLASFQRFLNQERANLAATPILLLENTTRKDTASEGTSPSQLIQQVQLLCTSVGLRTATAHPASGHFPFVDEIPHTIEHAKRVGATTILAVGQSSAIQLAKTITQENQAMEQLILVPETPAATLFANASHSLIVDPQETAMIPRPANNTPLREDLDCHVVLPEQVFSKQDPNSLKAALYAGLVLALDELYRGIENSQQTIEALKKTTNLIDQINQQQQLNKEMEYDLQEAMIWSGSNLSFGLASDGISPRSVPLALASSLVPTAFPDYQFVEFISALLPGLVALLQDHPQHSDLALELYHKLNSHCPRLAQSEGDQLKLNALISLVQDNGARWDCLDVDVLVLEKVLSSSLNLD